MRKIQITKVAIESFYVIVKTDHFLLPFIVTFPLVILRILKPTVGIISSLNWPDWNMNEKSKFQSKSECDKRQFRPKKCVNWWYRRGVTLLFLSLFLNLNSTPLTAMTLTNVVFPEYCRPTSVNSISSFQKRLLNQSKIRLIIANILNGTSNAFVVRSLGDYLMWLHFSVRGSPNRLSLIQLCDKKMETNDDDDY